MTDTQKQISHAISEFVRVSVEIIMSWLSIRNRHMCYVKLFVSRWMSSINIRRSSSDRRRLALRWAASAVVFSDNRDMVTADWGPNHHAYVAVPGGTLHRRGQRNLTGARSRDTLPAAVLYSRRTVCANNERVRCSSAGTICCYSYRLDCNCMAKSRCAELLSSTSVIMNLLPALVTSVEFVAGGYVSGAVCLLDCKEDTYTTLLVDLWLKRTDYCPVLSTAHGLSSAVWNHTFKRLVWFCFTVTFCRILSTLYQNPNEAGTLPLKIFEV